MLQRLRTCIAIASVAGSAHAASPQVLQDSFENPCHVDSDRDRVANCTETALQTSRFDADTDADGLTDGDEVFGSIGGLDLPGFGTSPRRKDLLLEIDWTDDSTGCAWHTHRPPASVIAEVQTFFASLPIANPDGSTGVNLIVDHGQGPTFAGGNAIGTASGTVSIQDVQSLYQPLHFAAARTGYFRYGLLAHRMSASEAWSGVAAGDAHLVTLQCQHDTPGYLRNTLIHELGHNLGLQHGGDTSCNRKPNYNSLMNYNHQFHGVDIDCDRFADGVDFIGFSDGSRNTLVKSALVESAGVCAASHPLAKAVDWNFNGVIDAQPVAVDFACSWLEVLEDWNDIAALKLPPVSAQNGGEAPPVAPGDACLAPPQPGDLP